MTLKVIEICAGAGGQSLGLELAGFEHEAAVEIDVEASQTLRLNRPEWDVICGDVAQLDGRKFRGVDLFAGGVPCPPFSIAGKQLGGDDERDLFPHAIRLISEISPRAVMLENVKGLASDKFSDYRNGILNSLERLGFSVYTRLLNASDFGVPQLRPRFIIVGLRNDCGTGFEWPEPIKSSVTVGSLLSDMMASRGWPGASAWSARAAKIGPTIVGGSKKHGGPDLGPTRARREWANLGVDGLGIANEPPDKDFPLNAMPRLTVRMVARLQGFPDDWKIFGKKTASYRQVGNAFPSPVAAAVGKSIAAALHGTAVVRKPSVGEQLTFYRAI